MKFERKHQLVKNFTKNCNYLNVSKTIIEKYSAFLELEFSETFEFKTHPLLKPNLIIERTSSNCVKTITYKRIQIKNHCETILITLDGSFFKISNIVETINDIIFEGFIIFHHGFDNALLAYKVNYISNSISTFSIKDIKMYIGKLFTFNQEIFVFFDFVVL